MERNTDSDSDWCIDTGRVTRRHALAAVGTVVGGGTLALVGSGSARAEVTVEGFEVADATFEAREVTPVIDATIGYAYRAESVAELWIGLLVGETVVAEESLMTGTAELENTTDLTGRVLDSDAYSASEFTVDRGGETTVTVEAGVQFAVRDADGGVLASDEATDSATVDVVAPEGETYATIGGEAAIQNGE